MVMMATSRWATWDSSWASTASSSGSSSRRMMPRGGADHGVLGLRPVAKALGMSASAMATRGFGMSARAHRRSTTPCSSGSCSGVTMWPCMPHRAILSENQYWQNSEAGGDDEDDAEAEADGEEDAAITTP